LETEKSSRKEGERTTKKRIEELGKEVAAKTVEIEGLKAKAKQYVDYDDVKRELEIMKVSSAPFRSICTVYRQGGIEAEG